MNEWFKKDGEEENLTQGMAFLWKDLGSGQWLKQAGHFSEGEEWTAKEESRESLRREGANVLPEGRNWCLASLLIYNR